MTYARLNQFRFGYRKMYSKCTLISGTRIPIVDTNSTRYIYLHWHVYSFDIYKASQSQSHSTHTQQENGTHAKNANRNENHATIIFIIAKRKAECPQTKRRHGTNKKKKKNQHETSINTCVLHRKPFANMSKNVYMVKSATVCAPVGGWEPHETTTPMKNPRKGGREQRERETEQSRGTKILFYEVDSQHTKTPRSYAGSRGTKRLIRKPRKMTTVWKNNVL